MYHLQTTPSQIPEAINESRIDSYERIVDNVGFLQNWQNPVLHEKYWEIDRVTPPSLLLGANCLPAVSSGRLPDIHSMLAEGMPDIPPDELHRLSSNAMSHFKNAVDPQVLLLNFIIELIETVKTIAEKATRIAETWETVVKRYRKRLKYLLKKGVREADAILLAWSFALVPFAGDLKKLLCSLEDAEKRTKWLYEHQGKVVRIRYRCEADADPGPIEVKASAGSYYYGVWNPSCPPWQPSCASPERDELAGEYILSLSKYKLIFTAQANVIYTLPPFRFYADGSGIASVWAAMMGLDRIGSAIWEAIPFSFVIDWFTDLGKQFASWIDDKTQKFPDGKVLETGHALKLETEWKLSYAEKSPCVGNRRDCGTIAYTKYQRKSGLPEGSDYSFDMGGLFSPYHVALETSLVTTANKRSKARRRAIRRALNRLEHIR